MPQKNMGGKKFLRAKKRALFIKDKKKRDSCSNRRMPLICNDIKFKEDGKVPLFIEVFWRFSRLHFLI